jgi:hypothetical protein
MRRRRELAAERLRRAQTSRYDVMFLAQLRLEPELAALVQLSQILRLDLVRGASNRPHQDTEWASQTMGSRVILLNRSVDGGWRSWAGRRGRRRCGVCEMHGHR